MFIYQIFMPLLMVFFIGLNNVYAAGSTINEDFSLVSSICDDMIEFANKGDQTKFLKLADSALQLSEAQRRDNSMAIDRFRPKIRAAKKAAKLGDYASAKSYLEDAKQLMKPASATWDGGH